MFHILVVDDDKNIRKLFQAILESEHYTVFTANNGDEALSVMEKEHIDLVVLDIMMPKVDGLMVLKLIRELEAQHKLSSEQQAKIIMMTAIADMEYVDQAFELGCDAYASKPIEIAQVQEVMQDLGLIS
mgnify:CR=1 FL=1